MKVPFVICAAAALLSLLPLAALRADDSLNVAKVPEALLQSRLAAGAVPNAERGPAIAELFRSVGCQPALQKVAHQAGNVICTLPGSTADAIVVGAHFDFVNAGQGIVDDWSGAAMLPSLYQALKSQQRKHSFIFVAFAKEEDGLYGSRKYVHSLDKDRLNAIRAFVNLECLGTGPTKVWTHRSTPELVQSLRRVASLLKTPLSGVDVDRVGDDDTHPFFNAKVPVISIHSLTQQTFAYLHSKRDRMDAIQFGEYAGSYRLIAFFLAYLDA